MAHRVHRFEQFRHRGQFWRMLIQGGASLSVVSKAVERAISWPDTKTRAKDSRELSDPGNGAKETL